MKKRAFTLIELAIVLTIVGIILGSSFKLLKNSREKAYISEAKEQVAAAKDAIIGDALEYGNLSTVANFDQNLSPATGELNEHKKKFFYYPDSSLTQPDADICAFNKTDLQIDFMKDSTVDHTLHDVAFVVAARSANRNLQTGASTSASTTTIKVYRPSDKKDDNSNDFIHTYDEFDDIVGWVTLSELQKSLDCSSNKLVIVNDYSLPRDGNCSKSLCYLGSNNVSLTATGGYPYDDDSDTNGHGDSDTDSDKDYLWCVEANSAFDNNFTINCASNNIVGTSSNYCGNTNNFHQCTNPILDSKAPLTAGSYSFRLFVKDKTKTTSKLFSITIDNR